MQHLQQTTLPGTLEVNRSRLQWVRRVVDLLGEIEAVVRLASKTARSMSTERDIGGQVILRSFADLVVAPSSLAGDGPRTNEQLHSSRHQASWLIVQAL